MKSLFVALFLFISSFSFAQTYYCVQLCSTQNPELLKPEMVSILSDTAMVEPVNINGVNYYRIILVYSSQEEQSVYHTSWLKQWSGAIMVTKTKDEIDRMYPLFTFD